MTNIARSDSHLPFLPVMMAIDDMSSATDEDIKRELECNPVLESDIPPCMQLVNYTRKIILCSFNTYRIPFRNVDPLVHVFSKAWPMRCSIRNFSEILSSYVETHRDVYTCIRM